MGKILSVDYGTKRTGIAITDAMQLIATGLTTVATHSLNEFLSDIMIKEDIECIVVGLPRNLDGTQTDVTRYVNDFIKRLERIYPEIIIKQVDERFTSKIAKDTILTSGVNKKRRQDKFLVDQVSATIILQSYLACRQ